MRRVKQLIREIHRRSLWQVLGVYLGASFALLEAVDLLIERIALPAAFFPFAFALLVVGLPIVLLTAFVQSAERGESAGRSLEPPTEGESDPAGTDPSPPARLRRLLTWRNALAGGVVAFALWGMIAAAWLLLGSGPVGGADVSSDPGPDPASSSVAVLPFTTRSAAKEDSFFAGGIHDDILTQLSKLADLKVISRTSVMRYAGTRKPIGEIAEELDVATVLEGGIQRAGDRVRINVQLIDARTDAHIWAERYDEALTADNIFAIQADIAVAVARALETRLSGGSEAWLAERPTESLEAYRLYNEARYRSRESTVEAQEEAIGLYRRAIAEDPEFAEAHAGLAGSYLDLLQADAIPRQEAEREARAAVERALRIDPRLARGHFHRGVLLTLADADHDAAIEAYRTAIRFDPGYAAAYDGLGAISVALGRYEAARDAFRRAVELDPLRLVGRANLAFLEYFNREYEAAETQVRRLLRMEPESAYGRYILALALSFQDRHEPAIEAARRAVELDPDDLQFLVGLAFVHARAGRRERALQLASEVETRGGSLTEVALVHGQLGDLDRAFRYLTRAAESSPGDLVFLEVDPSADPLRGDPRFEAVLEAVGR